MKGSILVSIHPPFAERIYSRQKQFELRKQRPLCITPRMFLFETGGIQAITGLALIEDIITDDVGKLWDTVGLLGATEERFFEYFRGHSKGNAFKLGTVLRYVNPIPLREIKSILPTFTVPQGYFYVTADSPLYQRLVTRTIETMQLQHHSRFALAELQDKNKAALSQLVLQELPKQYSDIDEDFIKSLTERQAPGFTSMSRQVYEMYWDGRLIGFTTLTFKLGNTVKTGPTLFCKIARGRGYGQKLRGLLHDALKIMGVRKVFCTCPALNGEAVNYLLHSGYAVEATLEGQYKPGATELVFGRNLHRSLRPTPPHKFHPQVEGRRIDAISTKRQRLPLIAPLIKRLMGMHYFEVDDQWVATVLRSWDAHPLASSKKKRKFAVAFSKSRPVAILVITPKRGGSLKVLLLRETNDGAGLQRMIKAVMKSYAALGVRKIYTYVNSMDAFSHRLFREMGFSAEGLLREPYREGADFVPYVKFLKRQT